MLPVCRRFVPVFSRLRSIAASNWCKSAKSFRRFFILLRLARLLFFSAFSSTSFSFRGFKVSARLQNFDKPLRNTLVLFLAGAAGRRSSVKSASESDTVGTAPHKTIRPSEKLGLALRTRHVTILRVMKGGWGHGDEASKTRLISLRNELMA